MQPLTHVIGADVELYGGHDGGDPALLTRLGCSSTTPNRADHSSNLFMAHRRVSGATNGSPPAIPDTMHAAAVGRFGIPSSSTRPRTATPSSPVSSPHQQGRPLEADRREPMLTESLEFL